MSEGDGSESLIRNLSIPHHEIVAFCERHGIRWFAIFGSILREDFRPDSDVDVLVEFKTSHIPTFFDLVEMEQELSALFGGRKVDLHTPRDLSRYFRQQVLEEAKVQYAAR
ncbi:MAG: nucleotidyltransferase family protein [Anaerolineales bacterium]